MNNLKIDNLALVIGKDFLRETVIIIDYNEFFDFLVQARNNSKYYLFYKEELRKLNSDLARILYART